jgi:hypothetical protein
MSLTPARAVAFLCAAALAVAGCAGDGPPPPSAPAAARASLTASRTVPHSSDWSAPVNLGPEVNSASGEIGPAISPDGLALYFTSDRPGGVGARDIWVTRRAHRTAPWRAPRNLGPVVNSSASDFLPALSPDGRQLFITSGRAGGQGDADVWVSRRDDTRDDFGWQAPVNLGAPVNTAGAEAAPYVVKVRGKTTLFFSRGPVLSNLDLFVSSQHGRAFGTPVPVAELNTAGATEAHATVRQNGREIFFYSDRPGGAGLSDIWTSTRKSTGRPWSTPVAVEPLNTAFGEVHPTLDRHGETLFFVSDRPGGSGGTDLYMATRPRRH